jgi:hypothetical protein
VCVCLRCSGGSTQNRLRYRLPHAGTADQSHSQSSRRQGYRGRGPAVGGQPPCGSCLGDMARQAVNQAAHTARSSRNMITERSSAALASSASPLPAYLLSHTPIIIARSGSKTVGRSQPIQIVVLTMTMICSGGGTRPRWPGWRTSRPALSVWVRAPSPAQPSTDIRAIVVISIVMIYRVGKEIDQQLGRQDPQAANIMIMAMMS